jgi:Leucine-rich repeat (LRR) protein
LIFNNCPKLEVISISGNYLTSFDFNNLSTENLKRLHIDDNNFSKQDLTAFSKFFNLEELDLGTNNKKRITKDIYNRFCGSLEPLKNMKNLSNLDIRSTDIDSGLEYLPENLQKIHCDSLKENSAC